MPNFGSITIGDKDFSVYEVGYFWLLAPSCNCSPWALAMECLLPANISQRYIFMLLTLDLEFQRVHPKFQIFNFICEIHIEWL
jgi:hypothetical protein